jgi:phosphate transport system ATP-binding protein
MNHQRKHVPTLLTTEKKSRMSDAHIQASPRGLRVGALAQEHEAAAELGIKLEARNFSFYYGAFQALRDVSLAMRERTITAIIGPSGCGKSTLLRAINRMHDATPGARGEGQLLLDGQNIYAPATDAVLLRRRVGMVFQRPNAFAKSIFDNVAYGLRVLGWRDRARVAERVERVLRQAALWDEVKDRLTLSALGLSGGQQQRLCIARAIAPGPDVLLMDEPCSALDPIATLKIEELMVELRREYTIVIVTHNMQQAARASDETAFMLMDPATRAGQLIEFGTTGQIFTHPRDKRTEDYVTGRFG